MFIYLIIYLQNIFIYVCDPQLQVLHDRDYSKQHTEKPGADVRVHLRGAPGMVVGLLAVDKAVYVINNRKSLSQNSVRLSEDTKCSKFKNKTKPSNILILFFVFCAHPLHSEFERIQFFLF